MSILLWQDTETVAKQQEVAEQASKAASEANTTLVGAAEEDPEDAPVTAVAAEQEMQQAAEAYPSTHCTPLCIAVSSADTQCCATAWYP